MRSLAWLALLLGALLVAGCGDKEAGRPGAAKVPAADVAGGKAFAEKQCKGCHGLDGKGAAPAIPHLAAQHEEYLIASLEAYRAGKRSHAALKDIATLMSEADARNVSAFYARLPALAMPAVPSQKAESPYDQGKALAEACAKCHGADGNSKTPGIPTLAGQQPHYLVVAINEYLGRERKTAPMHGLLPGMGKLEKENLALYFASQEPLPRSAPPFGDPAAGEPLTAVCGGCHGSHGISTDSSTPILAGQDARYLVDAIKAYRTTRKRETMRNYVAGLSDKDVENIAAFYSVQRSRASEKGQTLIKDLSDKCERCHGPATVPGMTVPKIRGQDRDYLIMALRAYRDDRRESSTMHKMSLPYSDSVIEALATSYSIQPPK